MTANNEIVPTESEEQKMVFEWAELSAGRYPELALLFHIPNGSYKSIAMAEKFKKEGLKSRVPDICLPVPHGEFHALFIEMKRTKGGKISENQKWWIDNLRQYGNRVEVCYGCEEAVAVLEDYLNLGQRNLPNVFNAKF